MGITIKKIKEKINTSNNIEQLIYSEAIELLKNEVNSDKVENWINLMIFNFNDKPKPLTEKEIKEKKKRREDKKEKIKTLNKEMENLLNEYGVLVIGFFDYKDIEAKEYNTMVEIALDNDYYFNDVGDGAVEPFVSTKKEIDNIFLAKYSSLQFDLDDDVKILNDYYTTDIDVFMNKIK